MALRHAVLAALLDGELSGYQLAKAFDVGVANFWYAQPQQLYAELTRLEKEGLVAGREVLQESRPSSATTCSSRSRPPTTSTPPRSSPSSPSAPGSPRPR